MIKQKDSFQSNDSQENPGLLEQLVAWVSAFILAAVIALSTSPAMAQGAGQFSLPTSIPFLGAFSDITPANFLPEVQNLVRENNARDLESEPQVSHFTSRNFKSGSSKVKFATPI